MDFYSIIAGETDFDRWDFVPEDEPEDEPETDPEDETEVSLEDYLDLI